MNYQQLKRAQERTTELLKYDDQTSKLRYFISKLENNRYLQLSTMHQSEMWSDARETFGMIGEELITILKQKLWEREDYLEKLNAEHLIALSDEE